jgi:hypothetical protein
MASSTERAVALALALTSAGCLSGHLLDAARRREVPVALATVALDDGDLVLTMRTRTLTDLGHPVGRGMTRARVALATLASARSTDDLHVRFESADGPPSGGRPLLVLASPNAVAPAPLARLVPTGPSALVLETRDATYPPLYLDGLTRCRYAPWVWAAMPLALAADAVVVPPLLLFAPAVVAVGD